MGKKRQRIHFTPGDRYGRLTVVQEAEAVILSGKRYRRILCVCDCGNETAVRVSGLRSGNVKSCGCIHATRLLTHGHSRSETYHTWQNIRTRCLNPNAPNYPSYGGSGIRVCERWGNFEAFLADLGERPSPRHSIDRIDSEGDYTPENCRWATPKEQARNRSSNRILTYDGETLCLAEWAERIGMKPNALQARLNVSGYTVKEALTLPLGAKRQ